MQKAKRITALVGVIALIALYVYTFILGIAGSENTLNMLMASVIATVVLPVLIWVYSFIYKLLKNHYSENARDNIEHSKNSEE